MRKLTMEQIAEKDPLYESILAVRDRLNASLLEDGEDVDELQEEVLEKLEEARDWLDDISIEQESCFEGRSEKWQEGEKGQDYMTWMEEFRSDQLEDPVIEPGRRVELDLTLLEDLPDRPD